MDAPDATAPQSARWRRPSEPGARRTGRLAVVAGLAIAAGSLAWVVAGRSDDPPARPAAPAQAAPAANPAPAVTRPTIRTVPQLRVAAASSAVPVYWAGPRSGMRLELSEAPGSTTFVRYLPSGARAGDSRPHLTIATYARPNGFAEIRAAARSSDAQTVRLSDGGIAVYDPGVPTNVHLAYPGDRYQIEVFSPEEGLALRLVEKHVVRPVR